MPFDQQLDIFGGRHDLAPGTQVMRLFDSAPQLHGQIALDTDRLMDEPVGDRTHPQGQED